MCRPEFPPFSSCFKLNLASKRRIFIQRKNAEQYRKTQKNAGKRSVRSGPQFSRSKHLAEALPVVNRVDFVPFKLFSGTFKKKRESPITFFIRKNEKKANEKKRKNKKKTEMEKPINFPIPRAGIRGT